MPFEKQLFLLVLSFLEKRSATQFGQIFKFAWSDYFTNNTEYGSVNTEMLCVGFFSILHIGLSE